MSVGNPNTAVRVVDYQPGLLMTDRLSKNHQVWQIGELSAYGGIADAVVIASDDGHGVGLTGTFGFPWFMSEAETRWWDVREPDPTHATIDGYF